MNDLAIDFQATGESSGDVITFGWRERMDAIAAVEFLRREAGVEKIAVLGVSLGGAAALLAGRALRVDSAVLEAVYPSIDRAINNRLRTRIGPLAGLAAPLLLWQLPWRLGASSTALRPIDHIAGIGCPVFVIGGADDRYTPAGETRQMFAAAADPKELWLIAGVDHVDFLQAAGDEYRQRILSFLVRTLN